MTLVRFWREDADGHAEENDTAADEIGLLQLLLNPAAQGNSVINGGLGRATNFDDGTGVSDLVTKGQLDAVAAGADSKSPCRVATLAALPAYTTSGGPGIGKQINITANGILAIDGVNTVLGDRVLIKDQAGSHIDHGIYEVVTEGTAGVAADLERVEDFDGNPNGEVKNGNYLYVLEGTQAFTGWMLNTGDPITVDTTALDFGQFQGLATFVFGKGLLKTGTNVDVELDTGADAQSAGNGGGSSGLEADVSGINGKLRAAVNATAAVERTASGLGVKLNGTTLGSGASGLAVLGLPSLFTINGTAVPASVSADALDELTGGDETSLHTHAGAPEAERVENIYTTDGVGVTIGDPVFPSANNVVSECDAANANTKRFIGLAKTTIGAASPVDVVSAGLITGVTVAGSPAFQKYVYIANGGGLTTVKPNASGDHRYIVGIMKNATDIQIIGEYLSKKA